MSLHRDAMFPVNVGKKIEPVFSVPWFCKRMHLGENVPRNAPRARNEDDRGEIGEEDDDARGGKEDRQMRLSGRRRRGSCTPPCTQPYRPSRVMCCDCTVYDWAFRTRYRLDRLSLPISDSIISAGRPKNTTDRYFVTRSWKRRPLFRVPAATS